MSNTTTATTRNTLAAADAKAARYTDGLVKFFRCYESMQRYINYRYGRQTVAKLLDVPAHYWESPYSGITYTYGCKYYFETRKGTYGFKQDLADRDFGVRAENRPVEYDGERYLRQQENMAAYIHSGAGLDNYCKDRDAGYVE